MAHHDITADDLFLLSNDIPRSYSPEIEDDSDSEEMVVGMYDLNRIVKQTNYKGHLISNANSYVISSTISIFLNNLHI